MKRLFPFIKILLALSFIFGGSCSRDNDLWDNVEEEITVYKLTSSVTPVEAGNISPAQGTFDSGEQVTILAISSKGYYFKNWSGNISGTDNPYTFTINSDTIVIAIFAADDTDEDGVTDIEDTCPDTPSGETVDANGCSSSQTETDTDGDGVTDNADTCPDTPSGEMVDAQGCSDSQRIRMLME